MAMKRVPWGRSHAGHEPRGAWSHAGMEPCGVEREGLEPHGAKPRGRGVCGQACWRMRHDGPGDGSLT
jgi:hypothetical protein